MRFTLCLLLLVDLALVAYGVHERIASAALAGLVFAVAAGFGLGLLCQLCESEQGGVMHMHPPSTADY